MKIHVLSCHDDDDDDDDSAYVKTLAGGSVANTVRGLRSGFGISSGIIGACGDDEQGVLFVHNMNFNGVDLSRLRKKKGHTAQVWLKLRRNIFLNVFGVVELFFSRIDIKVCHKVNCISKCFVQK